METTTTISNSAAATAAAQQAPPIENLVKFCLLWTVLQRTKPPQACHEVLKMRDFTENQIQLDHMLRNLKNNGLYQNWKLRSPHDNILTPNERDQMNAFQFHYQHTSRSLSVIGVLGGIVLILFFVALSTCIKHRRNLYSSADRYTHRENYAREILVDHLRQLRSHRGTGGLTRSNDRPPAYDEVVNKSTSSSLDDDNSEIEPPSYTEATNISEDIEEMTEVVTILDNRSTNNTIDISEPHHAQAQLSDNHQHQNQETEVTIETRGIILNELPTTTSNVAQ
jgi:hypothetical protein